MTVKRSSNGSPTLCLLGFPLAGADWSGAVVAYVWCASATTVNFLITTLMHRPRCFAIANI
jgi:hypothetical protein